MATRTISTKLAIEGEAQYKQALSSCNAELKTLKSSLALAESEYKNNANSMEALTAKGKALSDMQAEQAKKVSLLESALKNAQSHQQAYADAAADAGKKVAQYAAELEKLKSSTGDTQQEQAQLTAEIEKWTKVQQEAEAASAAAVKGVQSWQQQLNSAKIEQNSLSEAAQKNSQYLEEAAASADGCAKSIDEYGKEVKEAGDSSADFGDKSKSAIDQLAAVLASAGIAKGVQEIAEALMDCSAAAEGFEASIAKVATIADTSALSMDEIKAQIISLSSETGKSASAIAEATYQAISAGVDTAAAVDTVAQASKLAVGGFTQTETAVDVLTTAINAYKLSSDEAVKVSDILITTQNKGKTSVDELAKSVGGVIPLASAYNVELDNLGTAYAVLTASGTETSEAGTKIKAMLSELGDSGSKAAAVLQEQTGQSFAALTENGASLGDILAIIGDSVNGNTTAFNELWSSTEAGVGALSIFNQGADHFNSVLGEMQNSAGATEAAYKTMADTTENSHQRMKTAAENLKIAIGDQLNPALKNLYDTGADAFTWATDFVAEHPAVVKALAAIVTGLGTLAAGIAAITAVTAALNAIIAVANPITLIATAAVAAVTAIGAFAVMTTSADEEIKAFTSSLQDTKAAYDDLIVTMEGHQQSTAASLAVLEELLAVEDKSAAQKEIIAQKVAELNEAVPNLGLAYDAASDSINMTNDALERLVEKAGAQEQYAAQVSRISELYTEQKQIASELEIAQAALNEARETGSGSVITLQNNIDALTEAQKANAEEIAALEEASREYGERQAETTKKTEEMTSRVEELVSELEGLQSSYEKTYEEAMESLNQQMGLFEKMDGTAKTSIDNLIENLQGQVNYLDSYADNIKLAMEKGVDEGLVRKLSDGSVESAQILDAIVKGGDEKILALNEEFAKVETGKQNFSEIVAGMETDFQTKMGELVTDLEGTIQDMDLSDDAYTIGQNNIQGLINGAASKTRELIAQYQTMAREAQAAYMREVDQHSPSKKFQKIGSNDIKGIIEGAGGEKESLVAAYSDVAKAAVDSVEKALPSDVLTQSLQQSKKACEDLLRTIGGQRYEVTSAAASMRELLAVEEKSAAQKEIISRRVDELNEAVPELGLAYDSVSDSINMTGDALERLVEKSAEQQEYEARVSRLSELYIEQEKIALELEAAREALSQAEEAGAESVQILQESVSQLTTAQEENAVQIRDLESATGDYGDRQAEAAAKVEQMTTRLGELTTEVDNLYTAYEDIRKKAADSMESQLGLFKDLDANAEISIDSLIDSLRGQVDYMLTYANNIKRAMEMGIDNGLLSKLSDGRKESAQILAAIVQGGQRDIDALNEQFAKVELGKEYFAKTVADMEVEFRSKMGELVNDLNDALNEMDLQEEMYTIGMNNLIGLINGADSQREELVKQYTEMGKVAMEAYKREVDQHSPSKKFMQMGSNDIQGIIEGVEREKASLAAAYEESAQAALRSMERAMPSTFRVPQAVDNRTAAPADTVSNRWEDVPPIQIYVDRMEVRKEGDAQRVAQELYYLTARELRSRGGGML